MADCFQGMNCVNRLDKSTYAAGESGRCAEERLDYGVRICVITGGIVLFEATVNIEEDVGKFENDVQACMLRRILAMQQHRTLEFDLLFSTTFGHILLEVTVAVSDPRREKRIDGASAFSGCGSLIMSHDLLSMR